jgi:hypothetical protein
MLLMWMGVVNVDEVVVVVVIIVVVDVVCWYG